MVYSDELYHHGILGQKWGVRRYQNKDGTYTSLGKRLKNISKTASKAVPKIGGNKSSNAKKKSSFSLVKKKTQAEKDEDAALSLEEKKKKYAKSADSLYKHRDLYDTNELKTAYDRLTLENNVKSLIPKKVSKGEKYAKAIISGLTTTNNLVNVSGKTIQTGQKFMDMMDGKDVNFGDLIKNASDNDGNGGGNKKKKKK